MTITHSRQTWLRASVALAAALLLSFPLGAQTAPPARIQAAIVTAQSVPLPGSQHPQAQAQFDVGAMSPGTAIEGVTLVFNRSAAQTADLQALIAAQQNPSSPLYHQWLTPDQFAARFGMAPSDLEKVEGWLSGQGFVIASIARSRTFLRFSGTVGEVNATFATSLHYYKENGVQHFAPSTALSVPAAIASTVLAVRNLDDFRPQSHAILASRWTNSRLRPAFTSSETGSVFFAPGDIATSYDVKTLYSNGVTGAGESIAIIGQSAIQLSDLQNFQNAAGVNSTNLPNLELMPGTGTSDVNPAGAGDEAESDLDLEWSNAMAPGANIIFVYTGSDLNYGAFDSIQYAIDEDMAPIVSSSYGTCETAVDGDTLENTFTQAAAQGQTVLASAGDDGSTDCNGLGLSTAQQDALAVDYPASSPNVTAIGGTGISAANTAYLTAPSAYWEGATANGADVINSALQYLPETTWNDDLIQGTSYGIVATGGGASVLFSKPTWQAGVPGIPADGQRDVPDIALYASPYYPGYLFCTSDESAWDTTDGQEASCNDGFRDSATGLLTSAGGTSFGPPIFSAMLALISQHAGYTSGQGLINPILYGLAANPTTYASAFHDITTGNNDCTAGTTYCGTQTGGFSAGVGYDQVTGLGSLDVANLVNAWPASGSALIGTTTTVTPSTTQPAQSANDNFTITVSSDSGTTVPTGTLSITVDGGPTLGGTTASGTLASNGTYVFTTSFAAVGDHQIVAEYSGDATHATSTGSASVNVPGVSSATGSFALAATGISVAEGASGSSTITVTPSGGYTGTVDLTLDSSNDTALEDLCYDFTSTSTSGEGVVVVGGTTPVTTQLTLDTNANDCDEAEFRSGAGAKHRLSSLHPVKSANNRGGDGLGMELGLAGLFFAGLFGVGSREFRPYAAVIVLLAAGLAVSSCGGGSTSATAADPAPGTYTITVTGQDSTTATLTATTQFTFTIQ